jgi:hypothetical protein
LRWRSATAGYWLISYCSLVRTLPDIPTFAEPAPVWAVLKTVQDHLGVLNDIKVHQQLAPKLVAGKASTRGRQQAFAVGIVTGQEQSKSNRF